MGSIVGFFIGFSHHCLGTTYKCDRAYKNWPYERKNHPFLVCLLCHNSITIYTTAAKSSSLLQNSMGFLLQLTEIWWLIQNERYYWKYNSVQFVLTWSIFIDLVTNAHTHAYLYPLFEGREKTGLRIITLSRKDTVYVVLMHEHKEQQ